MVANLVHLRSYGVVVCNGLKVLVLNAVSHLTSLNQLLYSILDNLSALGNLLDNLLVARSEIVGCLLREDVVHALHVLS